MNLGEDKDLIRMQGSYNNHSTMENSIIIPQEKPRIIPDPINSGGSKFKHVPNPNPSTRPINYRECLKNHAANIGGHVTDGCGEFMPSGEDGTLEALKCAACNCHRNFHRKEQLNLLQLTPAMPSPSMSHHRAAGHWNSMIPPPAKMNFAGTDSSSDELNFNPAAAAAAQFARKKRHRTKFTPEQKEKMLEFAEKLGWRIPREDDSEMQRFCGEVGVKRQVFKVWMHNNKSNSASAKKNPPEF